MPKFFLAKSYTSHSGAWDPFDDGVTSGVQILSGNTGTIVNSGEPIGGAWLLEDEGYAIQHDINDLPAGFTIIDYDINYEPNPTIIPGVIGLNVEVFRDPESIGDLPHLPIFAPNSQTLSLTPSPGETYQIVAAPYGSDPWLQAPGGGYFGTYELVSHTWTLEENEEDNTLEISSDGANPDLTTVEEIIIDYTTGDTEKRLRISTSKFLTWTIDFLVVPIPPTCDVKGLCTVSAVISTVEYEITTIELV